MKRKRNPGEKLSQAEWLEIQAKYQAGERVVDLAKKYNVHPTNISKRAKAKGWKPHGSLKAAALAKAEQQEENTLAKQYSKALREETEFDYKVNRLLKDTLVKQIKQVRARIEAFEANPLQDWYETADPNNPGKKMWVLYPRSTKNGSHELNVLTEAMRSVQESQRDVMRAKEKNPFEETEVDQHRLDRLRECLTPITYSELKTLGYGQEAQDAEEVQGPAVHAQDT